MTKAIPVHQQLYSNRREQQMFAAKWIEAKVLHDDDDDVWKGFENNTVIIT